MQRLIAVAALLLVAGASHAQTFEKKNFNYSKFAKGAFSEVVTVTGPAKTIYLAGIGSEDEDDGSVRHKDDFLAQCRFAWQKIGKLLLGGLAPGHHFQRAVVRYAAVARLHQKPA